MTEINIEQLKMQIKELKKQGDILGEIIKPFINESLTELQYIELCQVGKFITLLPQDAKIIERRESPDFIISYQGEQIGLEHKRVVKKENVKSIQSVSTLFKDSARVFENRYPDLKLLANFWLTVDNFSFKKGEALAIQESIVNYTHSIVMGTHNFPKPDFIKEVRTMKHKHVSFNYNAGAHMISYITKEILEEEIKEKERKVFKYIENTNLERQWLLLVIGSSSQDSYEYGDYPFSIDLTSKFEKIFLLEDFDNKLWIMK